MKKSLVLGVCIALLLVAVFSFAYAEEGSNSSNNINESEDSDSNASIEDQNEVDVEVEIKEGEKENKTRHNETEYRERMKEIMEEKEKRMREEMQKREERMRKIIEEKDEKLRKIMEFKERLFEHGGWINVGGRNITIKDLTDTQKEIIAGKINARTGLNLTAEDINSTTLLRAYLSNGRYAYVKYMPDRASEIALKKLRAKCIERNCTVELKEVGNGNKSRLAYVVQTEKNFTFLFFFKNKMIVRAEVDAETGQVISIHKPWWAFLAREKDEDEHEIEQETESNETSENETENEISENETANNSTNEEENESETSNQNTGTQINGSVTVNST